MQALNAGTQAIQQRPGRPSGSTLVRVIIVHLIDLFGDKGERVGQSAHAHKSSPQGPQIACKSREVRQCGE